MFGAPSLWHITLAILFVMAAMHVLGVLAWGLGALL